MLEPGVSALAKILHYSAYILFILALIMLGKFVIIVGIVGAFIVNFFSRKKLKKSNPNFEKTIDKTFEDKALNENQFSNQDKKIDFKDDDLVNKISKLRHNLEKCDTISNFWTKK